MSGPTGSPRVFVHLGTHKTGTTTIQVLLDRHQAALERSGYLYPAIGRAPEGPNGHHNFAWEVTGDRRFNEANGTIDDLVSALERSPGHAILSSEDFEGAVFHEDRFAGFVQRLRASGRDVTFIVYLRRQADYAESLYQTMVRLQMPHTFQDFADEILDTGRFAWREWIFPFSYPDLLDRLESLPGTSVVVRSYDAPAQPPLVSDFCSAVGLDPAVLDLAQGVEANLRPPLFDCLVAFCESRRGAALDQRELEIVRSLTGFMTDRAPRMSPGLRDAFAERFQDSNARVCVRHGIPEWAPDRSTGPAGHAPLDLIFSTRFLETFARLSELCR